MIIHGSSLKVITIKILKTNRYVLFGISHGYRDSCSIRTVTPSCCNSAGLVGYKLQKLLHIVWICNKEKFFIPLSFRLHKLINSKHKLLKF